METVKELLQEPLQEEPEDVKKLKKKKQQKLRSTKQRSSCTEGKIFKMHRERSMKKDALRTPTSLSKILKTNVKSLVASSSPSFKDVKVSTIRKYKTEMRCSQLHRYMTGQIMMTSLILLNVQTNGVRQERLGLG